MALAQGSFGKKNSLRKTMTSAKEGSLTEAISKPIEDMARVFLGISAKERLMVIRVMIIS